MLRKGYEGIVLQFERVLMESTFDRVEYENLRKKLPEVHPAIGTVSPPK